jgi:hypothetical protein
MKKTWAIGWVLGLMLGAGLVQAGAPGADEVKLPVIDLRMGLRALVSLADEHLEGIMNSLRMAAASDEVRSGDWQKMQKLLMQLQKYEVPSVFFYARPDGTYFTTERGLVDKSIQDRPYFARLLTGKEIVGDLVRSRSTGKAVAVVGVPVMEGGKMIGAVGASIFLVELSQLLARQIALPDDMVFYAINELGETALHSDVKWLLEEPAKLRSQTLTSAVRTILDNWEGTARYDFEGKRKVVTYTVSALSGWHFVLGFVEKPLPL